MFDTLQYINKHSKYVSVNTKALEDFVDKNKKLEYRYWLEDLKRNLNEEQLIIFAFLCESINFCFWGNEKYNKNYIGSETIFNQLKKISIENPKILNVEYLANINEQQFNDLFEKSYKEIPLMKKRYDLLKQTISIILSKEMVFWDELFSFRKDLELLKYLTETFPAFKDESEYLGRKIYFNKKANLLVNDLFWLSERIRKNLKNLDELTGGADYAVPRILFENHILIYNNELLSLIKAKKIIPHNSVMEIEIRANTLYVIETMKMMLQKQGIEINSIQLDNIIWRRRNDIKHTIPVHRTVTTCY